MDGRPPFLDFFLSRGFTLAETHISWVLLGENDVYKFKKPVALGFLDYSSREKRHAACRAELELNQRLATGIYLGVVPVQAIGAEFRLGDGDTGDEGQSLDWAVHMVRLPAASRADVLLAAGKLGAPEIEALAIRLAAFHQAARQDENTAAYGRRESIAANVAENFAQGQSSLEQTLRPEEGAELQRWQTAFLEQNAATLKARVAAGRVRDGHGDLRLEHVYFLEAGIVVVDCIEFNERFRFADVAADIAFLAMDLTKNRRPDLAELLLAAYAREADDFGLYGVVDFYESYRAHVRAKIAGFVADDPGASEKTRDLAEAEARKFYLLALASERRALLPPKLIAVGGQIASGKSTLARELGRALAAPVIEADRTRKLLLGVAPTEKVHEAPWQGAYSAEKTQKLYAALRQRAAAVLSSGRSVLVDASFRKKAERTAMRELAKELGVAFLFLECQADPAICRQRLEQRAREKSTSDGRLEIWETLQAAWEEVDELPAEEHRRLDTTRPTAEIVAELLTELPALPVQLP